MTTEDEWRPCPSALCEAERLVSTVHRMREAVAQLNCLIARLEIEGVSWSGMDIDLGSAKSALKRAAA